MDINSFIQIVNGVGFPIAACIAMAIFIVWDKKTRRESRKEQNEIQNAMYQKLSDTVEANTSMVEKLIEKIEREVIK